MRTFARTGSSGGTVANETPCALAEFRGSPKGVKNPPITRLNVTKNAFSHGGFVDLRH